ncbi:hypothetical protein AWC38_SpisGene10462 [Stylophora pistillata]|uniref:Uncharacterized protein n=1 Tax=Stylophora pistillata TaxID=50429 RepID=A0A2B4S797_STYPI|nr:hypothetical protein AWC38_SpisGene10462 [Stylophora pistillata]
MGNIFVCRLFDEPRSKNLKLTNRFRSYISLNNRDFKKLENICLSGKKTDESVSKYEKDLDIDGQLSEKILSLKRSRAGFKASLRKKTNDLWDLMTEEGNVGELKLKFKELLESWERFEDAHKKLHSILTNDDEIDESLRNYEKENEAICEIKEKIFTWIYAIESAKLQDEVTPLDSINQVSVSRVSKSSKVSKVSHTNSSSSSGRRRLIEETANRKALEAKLKLLKEKQELAERKLELQKIKEEEEFHLKAGTRRDVENEDGTSPCIKELVAQQQRSALTLTPPKPEEPVFSGDPMEYNKFVKAFETLIEAWMDSHSAWLYYLVQYTSGAVQELMQSCSLMDSDKGYQEARRLLRSSCKNTLKGTEYHSKIDNPDSLKGIVNCLLYDAWKRWRFMADNISEKENRQVTLDDIASFVVLEVRAATHPVSGDISGNLKDKESHKRKPPVRPKGSSFGTQTDKTNAKKDKQEEKKESGYSRPVKSKGIPEDSNQSETSGINNGFVEVDKTQCSSFGVNGSRIGLTVVPVKVKAEEENLVGLPTVFSVKSLPLSAEDVPKQGDVVRWPHLHGIRVSELDVPVGLLVGNDNIKALEPKEIRQSEGGGTYATKTRFGWAINGPLGSDHKESKCTANLIITDHELNERFKNFCNREFSECIADSELGHPKMIKGQFLL